MLFIVNSRSRQDISRRHSSILSFELDFVNSKKAPLFYSKSYFYNKIARRPLSSDNLNCLIERKRELENEITPLLLKNLKNDVWPLEDPKLYKKVQSYIEFSSYLLSIMSAKKFIKTFSMTISDNIRILAENYETRNFKRPEPLVDRNKIKNI